MSDAEAVTPVRPGLLSKAMALAILLVVLCIPLTGPWFGLASYDQHRVGQLGVIILATAMLLHPSFRSPPGAVFVNVSARRILCALLLLALLSASASAFPFWALLELALVAGCFTFGWFVSRARAVYGAHRFDRVLLAAIFLLGIALVTRFLVSYASLITFAEKILDTEALLEGFPNLRFYGHFQTLITPLLALPLLGSSMRRPRNAAVFLLLMLWWVMIFAGGTRGTWLGLAAALVILCFVGSSGRHWSGIQAAAAAGGFALFYMLMAVVPSCMGFEFVAHSSERLTMTLSGRDLMWWRALAMIQADPLLGAGPMHYAHTGPPDYAGPHQMILLWFSEWGIPAALLWMVLTGWAAIATCVLVLRNRGSREPIDQLRLVLAASFCGALAHAMVCGIFTVPYTQLWLGILGGWLLAVWKPEDNQGPFEVPAPSGAGWKWIAVISALLLAVALIYFAPRLEARRLDFYSQYPAAPCLYPRFWAQGFIGL